MGVADNLDNRTGILRDLVIWPSGGQRKHNGFNRIKCTSGTLRLEHMELPCSGLGCCLLESNLDESHCVDYQGNWCDLR